MSEGLLSFDPIIPTLFIGIGALILLSAFCWFEFKRKQKFLILRVVACLLIVISLLGIFLTPSIIQTSISTKIILTERYNKSDLDSILKKYPNAEIISSINSIRDLPTSNTEFIIIGNGLSLGDEDYLNDVNFNFLPGEIPNGIIKIDNPIEFKSNQVGIISGTFNHKNEFSKIRLKGPSGIEDSIGFSAKGEIDFALRLNTKEPGYFLYQIEEFDEENDLIHTSNLPVHVNPPRALNILLYFEYPTAEIRYLKNFLADQGHHLTIRNKVSSDRYRDEFINTPVKSINLKPEFLNSLDLIISDISTLEKTKSIENKAIENALKDGLGLLVIYTAEIKNRSNALLPFKIKTLKSDTSKIRLPTNKIITAEQVFIDVQEPIQSMLLNSGKSIVEGYKKIQQGKIGLQLLQNTFHFILNGDQESYAYLWSPFMDELARRHENNFSIILKNEFPIAKRDPITFSIVSAGEVPEVLTDSIPAALGEDLLIDDWWHGKTWFQKPGFHTIKVQNDSTEKIIYVADNNEWSSLRIFNQQKMMKRYEKQLNETFNIATKKQPINSIYFFLLFLVAAGFLWLAPKL